MPEIVAALRVKNEARWIESVLRSVRPLCERVFVFENLATLLAMPDVPRAVAVHGGGHRVDLVARHHHLDGPTSTDELREVVARAGVRYQTAPDEDRDEARLRDRDRRACAQGGE